MSDVERLAKVEAWRDAHEVRCTERYNRIAQDTTEIKTAIVTMATDLKSAVERIHGRIDTEAQTARTATESAIDKIDGQKIWLLTTAVGAAGVIIAFLVDKLWKH